jgi:methylphosphotriester-DNA--protein-cysteine methyltransferase
MNCKNRLFGIFLCLSFTLASSFTVFAWSNQKLSFPGNGCKVSQQILEKIAKDKGITVDELITKLKAERAAKFEKMAKERGISVEALKKQFKAEHKATMEKMAKERGVTVEALKKQLKSEHNIKLEKIAKDKGITVEELKKQFIEKRLLEKLTNPN